MRFLILLTLGFLAAPCIPAYSQSGDAPADAPRRTPLTRPELKQHLEAVKTRQPRIPLPELTDEDRKQLGDRADNYEARVRHHYLSSGDSAPPTRNGRALDPRMTLDHGFKVELFWIVSRVNNCPYCIGHQETKLLAAGRNEDRIAALDGDWASFTPAERSAFAFARKFTYQPRLLSDRDIDVLRPYYSDAQILEMILSMAWNNSINRWKEAVGVPQNPDEGGFSRLSGAGSTAGARTQGVRAPADDGRPRGSYLTPTSALYLDQISQVAVIHLDPSTGQPSDVTKADRVPLESLEFVGRMLDRCRTRSPRLPLAEPAVTRERMAWEEGNESVPPNWMRLLAQFPVEGVRRAQGLLEAERNGDLDPLLKAQLAWIVARQDGAWYAAGEALRRLRGMGESDQRIAALDGDWREFAPRQQSLFRLARNLAASPVVLTDADVAEAVAAAGPAEVVQAIHYVTQRTALDRITEAAGLPLEE